MSLYFSFVCPSCGQISEQVECKIQECPNILIAYKGEVKCNIHGVRRNIKCPSCHYKLSKAEVRKLATEIKRPEDENLADANGIKSPPIELGDIISLEPAKKLPMMKFLGSETIILCLYKPDGKPKRWPDGSKEIIVKHITCEHQLEEVANIIARIYGFSGCLPINQQQFKFI